MKKILIISLLASSSIIFAGEAEDFKTVNELYKEKNFKSALVESEKFLEKYPESKHQKSMRDKVAKIYFLEKEYKKAEEVFKKLFVMISTSYYYNFIFSQFINKSVLISYSSAPIPT